MRLLRAETAQHHSYGRAGASKVLTGLSETWSRQQELNVSSSVPTLVEQKELVIESEAIFTHRDLCK